MSPERWNRLKSAYGIALDTGGVSGDLLADDPELRRELDVLLGVSSDSHPALDDPSWLKPLLPPTVSDDGSSSAGSNSSMARGAGALTADGLDDEPLFVPGLRVMGYTVRSLIGRGGMGEVYRVEQGNPRREVALKVLSVAGLSRRTMRRFEAESAILARLNHPGIASVIEAGVVPAAGCALGSRPYFTMELVDGVAITEFVRSCDLVLRDRIELVRRVCEAVAHAHERGVIHRDLKPANILVTSDGRPKVLDFGIARVMEPDQDQSLTRAGWVPGTLAYMSPEQTAGDADAVDTRSDVYALGAILHELIAGSQPIPTAGRSPAEAMRAIREESPAALVVTDRSLRADLRLIVATALQKDPALRYQSAWAMAEDLRRLLAREPLLARRPSVGYVAGMFVRRRWRECAAVSVVVLAGLVATGVQYGRTVRAQQLAQQRLDEVRRTSSELVTDLYDKLWQFSSTAEVRVYLAGEAMRRLDALVAAGCDDPATLWDLSTAVYKFGQASGHPGQPNIGQFDQARELIGRACAMREQVLATDPSNRLWREGTAASNVSLALITADAEVSDQLMSRGLALYASVCEEFPRDCAARDRYAYTLASQASRRSLRKMEFVQGFEQAQTLCEKNMTQEPGNSTWVGTLGTVLSMHAAAVNEVDPDAAMVLYERAEQVLKRASELDPDEYTYVRHCARALWARAAWLVQSGRTGEAVVLTDAALATHRTWHAKEPGDSVRRSDLVLALISAAEARVSARAMEALALAREARDLVLGGKARESLSAMDGFLLGKAEAMIEKLDGSGGGEER